MRAIKIFIFFGLVTIVVYSCVNNDLSPRQEDTTIQLRWSRAYPTEKREDVITGLAWDLSFLGASLQKGSLSKALAWQSESLLELDLSKVGFNDEALKAFSQLITAIKASEEYSKKNGIDIGRFVMLTLNSSNHYYAITGIKKSLNSFRSHYEFEEKKMLVVNSGVSKIERLIEISIPSNKKIAFIAQEGKRSVTGEFVTTGYEVLDVMNNGQLRFAIYDKYGQLELASDTSSTFSGKPAKCLWCHEININTISVTPTIIGYYTSDEFKLKVLEFNNAIKDFRTTLISDIDFSKTQDHTFMELLYIAFMEPSEDRLSKEWSLSLSEVQQRVGSLSTHQHSEFPFLGSQLFKRSEVDRLSPYSSIQVPSNAREPSSYEPDLIH
jgi:hypothetical protein